MFWRIIPFYLALFVTNAFAFYTQRPKNFFVIESEAYSVTSSSLNTTPKQKIGLTAALSSFSWNHMLKPHTGLRLQAGQEYIHLAWKNSPEFHRTNYNAFLFSTGVFTDYFENWWILSQAGFATDTNHFKIQDYTQFRFLLHTRYNYQERFRIHLGFLGTYGFRCNRVIPIIGIDFSKYKHLKINLVFPTNMSLVWEFNHNLSAILRYRLLQFARRFDENDIRPKGALLYDNQSLELAVRATVKQLFSLQGFIGWAAGDKIRIESRNGVDRNYYNFKSGFIYGAAVFFIF